MDQDELRYTRDGIKVDLNRRPPPWAAVISLTAMMLAPIVAWATGADPADILRVFVLTQAAIVWGMYLVALVTIIRRLKATRKKIKLEREIRLGHACEVVFILGLLSEAIYNSVQRLGHRDLNPRTPYLQLLLIFGLLGWLLMERRQWRPWS